MVLGKFGEDGQKVVVVDSRDLVLLPAQVHGCEQRVRLWTSGLFLLHCGEKGQL